jgi:S1-C subfamily serine protease
MVLCVGDPFGERAERDPLLTVGIVSRTHDEGSGDAWHGSIQTDAAVTDANCGGAVVDLRGRLLGVATIWNPLVHGRASGVSFVVPWERVLGALRRGTSVRFGSAFLGVAFEDDEPGEGGGARIRGVVEGGPADEAGIRPGDRIAAVDGAAVRQPGEAVRRIRVHQAGDRVRLSILRDGRTLVVEVDLGERPPPSGTGR